MAAGSGVTNSEIMGASGLLGFLTSPITAWLADLSPGAAALIGTIIVGLFGVIVREGFNHYRWILEQRAAGKGNR